MQEEEEELVLKGGSGSSSSSSSEVLVAGVMVNLDANIFLKLHHRARPMH